MANPIWNASYVFPWFNDKITNDKDPRIRIFIILFLNTYKHHDMFLFMLHLGKLWKQIKISNNMPISNGYQTDIYKMCKQMFHFWYFWQHYNS